MTDAKSKKKNRPEIPARPPFVEAEFIPPSGIPQTVIVPPGEPDLSTGIPVSLDVSPLYEHMPEAFQRELVKALRAQGLVKAADYFQPDAGIRFRAAMLSVIRHDFLNVQTLAKEEMTDVR